MRSNKNNNQHSSENNSELKLKKLFQELSSEVKNNHSLAVIENTMWSMRTLVVDSELVPEQIKDDYQQLFNIVLPRVENLIKILDKGLAE